MSNVHHPTSRCGEPHPEFPDATCIHEEGHQGLPVTFGGHPFHLTHADGEMLAWNTPQYVPLDGAVLNGVPADTAPAIVETELAEAEAMIGEADGWMSMIDPDRPWLMMTTDGNAWIQCADCDTWIQATPGMSLEQAGMLADLHRATTYPHVQNVQVGRPVPPKLSRWARIIEAFGDANAGAIRAAVGHPGPTGAAPGPDMDSGAMRVRGESVAVRAETGGRGADDVLRSASVSRSPRQWWRHRFQLDTDAGRRYEAMRHHGRLG